MHETELEVLNGSRQPVRDGLHRRGVAPYLTVCLLLCLILGVAGWLDRALGMQPIVFGDDQDRIEITKLGDYYEGRGDRLQLEVATGADGLGGRFLAEATTRGTNPNWVVFAIRNPSDKPIERWLTAERYNIIGSGLIWPDLDARRLEALTPSVGFVPERVKSDRADIFRLTVDPGQTITYAAELSSERMPSLYLWNALSYEQRQREKNLFNGIMLGVVGLLAVFLTAIFAANHKAIFPSAAMVAWCVLAYLCIDFGFWHKLFQLRATDNAVYRASAEASVATSLVVFLYAFLRIGIWHRSIKALFLFWILAQGALIALAVIDPRLAAMLARASFIPCALIGSAVLLYLAMRGQDRALSLVPTWLLFLVFLFAAGVTINGRLSGDLVVSGLTSGLVLIVVLLGFTVTQFAFRSTEPSFGASPNALQQRSLAIEGAGASVWEWSARRDDIHVSPAVEQSLGLDEGALSRRVDDFVQYLHQQDRERFKLMLWSVREKSGGDIRVDFRLRKGDGTYRWFELQAASVPHEDHKSLKCAGLLRDITDAKRAHERLVHDAVHDSLTGLPNRELFLDRLGVAVAAVKQDGGAPPVVLFIDIDRFKNVNNALGLIVGDSMLLTLARRLSRHLRSQDTLARIGGDQFGILLSKPVEATELAMFAERVRRSLRTPMKISGQDIVLTGSIGIATYDGHQETAADLLRDAENSMYRAKKGGADRVEVFKPEMRGERDDHLTIESDLRSAIENRQIRIVYQPIMRLPMEELAGFEALIRWNHPRHGLMNPDEFVPIAEESDLIAKLGSFVLDRASADAALWQKELPRSDKPLFVSVNVSRRQLFRQDLITEIRHILGRETVVKGTLHLEVTESLVMENAEQAAEMLGWLKSYGAKLSLDDFGTGYSSLAYLHRFPFDIIKIDRSLLRTGGVDNSGHLIIKSMVTLAHELGKEVVAEGVETADDASFLRSIGCEYAQGFYYGEPIGEREVLELLRLIRRSDRGLDRSWFGGRRNRDLAEAAARSAGLEASTQSAPSAQRAQAAQPPAAEHVESAGILGGANRSGQPIPSVSQPGAQQALLPVPSTPSHAAAPRTGPTETLPHQRQPVPVPPPSHATASRQGSAAPSRLASVSQSLTQLIQAQLGGNRANGASRPSSPPQSSGQPNGARPVATNGGAQPDRRSGGGGSSIGTQSMGRVPLQADSRDSARNQQPNKPVTMTRGRGNGAVPGGGLPPVNGPAAQKPPPQAMPVSARPAKPRR